MRIWVTVDPGISGTGWAEFCGTKLLKYGIIYGKGKDWREKAHYISQEIFRNHAASAVFIEWPSYQTLVAQNTGSIIKLAYLCGLLNWPPNTSLIPVVKWKGQLPKTVTQKRAEKFFKQKGFKSHAADAVGIGQFVIESGLI